MTAASSAMRAFTAVPGRPGTAGVSQLPIPTPSDGQVLIRTLEVGVCGTDREITRGLFGKPPSGAERLVLGHEFVGVVEHATGDWVAGDFVTAPGRRPCGRCAACAVGSADSCLSGNFIERGITGLDGFAADFIVEYPEHLVRVPRQLGRLAVLAEPTAVCERGIRHSELVGGRQPWAPRGALVIGGGALGILSALLLRLRGFEVSLAARSAPESEKARIVGRAGVEYISLKQNSLDQLAADGRRYDLTIAAVGTAETVIHAVALLGTNGVACTLGIDGHSHPLTVPRSLLGFDLPAKNQVLIGSLCSNTVDWEHAIDDLTRINQGWPGTLDRIVGLRVPVEDFGKAINFSGVKATLTF